jgi:hypothetical protein
MVAAPVSGFDFYVKVAEDSFSIIYAEYKFIVI